MTATGRDLVRRLEVRVWQPRMLPSSAAEGISNKEVFFAEFFLGRFEDGSSEAMRGV